MPNSEQDFSKFLSSPPRPGERGKMWGPAIASPRCAAPHPVKELPSLETLLRLTFEKYARTGVRYVTKETSLGFLTTNIYATTLYH